MSSVIPKQKVIHALETFQQKGKKERNNLIATRAIIPGLTLGETEVDFDSTTAPGDKTAFSELLPLVVLLLLIPFFASILAMVWAEEWG